MLTWRLQCVIAAVATAHVNLYGGRSREPLVRCFCLKNMAIVRNQSFRKQEFCFRSEFLRNEVRTGQSCNTMSQVLSDLCCTHFTALHNDSINEQQNICSSLTNTFKKQPRCNGRSCYVLQIDGRTANTESTESDSRLAKTFTA